MPITGNGYPGSGSSSRNGYGYGSTLPWGPLLTGVTGFDEAAFASDPGDLHGSGFGAVDARRLRYALYWALYEGNVYRRIHHWAAALRERFDLYPATRSIYCPTYRQVEFWAGHLWGGTLDQMAGDGVAKPSALPIAIPETNLKGDDLRRVLAQLWSADFSDWQTNKDIVTRLGSALGDVGLTVVDDPRRQMVWIQVVHPRTIRSLDKDAKGSVHGYEMEELRPDPRPGVTGSAPGTERLVGYLERAERSGQQVVYQTYLDDGSGWKPYDWRTYRNNREPRFGPEWKEDYGFVPFFHIQHRNMKLGWGWAEPHPSLSKLLELHDAASLVGDKFRQAVNAKWFFAGMLPPGSNPTTGRAGDLDLRRGETEDDWTDRDDVRSARNDEDAIYCADPKGTATPLVAPLDLNAALEHLKSLLAELERDHPELRADDVGPASSGAARRIAREKVEAMVVQRRLNYDDALVRAQMAAVSIGAMKGYPGFEAFDADSFKRGELNHTIGPRPVFAVDEMDRLEEKTARAKLQRELVDSGWPSDLAAAEAGYAEETVERLRAVARERVNRVEGATEAVVEDGF